VDAGGRVHPTRVRKVCFGRTDVLTVVRTKVRLKTRPSCICDEVPANKHPVTTPR
jgi:hypothetical protein